MVRGIKTGREIIPWMPVLAREKINSIILTVIAGVAAILLVGR
jgi:hypothetical protein